MGSVQESLDFLGMKVVDKVTGLKGVVTSISFDLYGCVQALVTPPIGKDGNRPDSKWLDISRLKVGSGPVMTRPEFNLKVDKGAEDKPPLDHGSRI